MSHIRKHSRLLLAGVCCVAVGAGASAVAGAGAATSSTKTHQAHQTHKTHKAHKGGLRGIARRTVHGQFVIHTKAGFRTVTVDRGVVDSVSGQQLKLTEGTPKATYKTVTLAIPADAVVRDDKQKTSLSSVKAGQRVLVVSAPKRTLVIARTPRVTH
jgi:acyl CoA:acetate/3-ketoacid CoA transferase beta subunit